MNIWVLYYFQFLMSDSYFMYCIYIYPSATNDHITFGSLNQTVLRITVISVFPINKHCGKIHSSPYHPIRFLVYHRSPRQTQAQQPALRLCEGFTVIMPRTKRQYMKCHCFFLFGFDSIAFFSFKMSQINNQLNKRLTLYLF